MPFLLAALLALPIPPLGATLGSGTPYHIPVANQATTTVLPATGLATYYSEGIFPGVIRNQIAYGNIQPDACPQCIGWAAMLWPDDLDRVVCVNGYGPLWVVDSAAGHHRDWLIERGWIIDLDRATWLALNFLDTPTTVTVTEC